MSINLRKSGVRHEQLSRQQVIVTTVDSRWRQLDPLLRSASYIVAETAASGLRWNSQAEAAAITVLRLDRVDADTLIAAWGAHDTLRIVPLVAGRLSSCRDLLTKVIEDAQQELAALALPGREAVVSVAWPSGEVWAVRTLYDSGLRPVEVLAASTIPYSHKSSDLHCRPAIRDDCASILDMWIESIEYESNFGAVTCRQNTLSCLQEELDQAFDEKGRTGALWVCEMSLSLCGFIKISPPSDATSRFAARVDTRACAYIDALWVAPDSRRRGIGKALTACASEAAEAWDADVVLLHYALTSPFSGPFWHQMGYRPILTTWRSPG